MVSFVCSDNIDRVKLTEGETFLWTKVVENCANHENTHVIMMIMLYNFMSHVGLLTNFPYIFLRFPAC